MLQEEPPKSKKLNAPKLTLVYWGSERYITTTWKRIMAIKIPEVSRVGYRQGCGPGFPEEDLQVTFYAEAWVRSRGGSSPGPAGQPGDMGTWDLLHPAGAGPGSPRRSRDGQTQHQTASPRSGFPRPQKIGRSC